MRCFVPQVPAALVSAGRILCCSSWLVASQHAAAALPLQQLRQYPHPALPQHAHFTTSSHARSGQQQQQQKEKQQQEGAGSSQHGANVQQEAKEASKGLVAKNFDMEELWFAAVGGKLKVWSARSHPDLKASAAPLFLLGLWCALLVLHSAHQSHNSTACGLSYGLGQHICVKGVLSDDSNQLTCMCALLLLACAGS